MDLTHKSMERIYRWLGPVYNFIYGKLIFDEGRLKAIELLEIRPGDVILEVGVGTGLTLPLYPNDCHVDGIDLSESMLKEARQLISKKGLVNCEVQLMNANNLKFPDNHFDKVLANLFISATHNPQMALNEMKRVCKPGGLIVLMNHFKADEPWLAKAEEAFNPIAQAMGFTSSLEMSPLLKEVKLKPKRLEKVNFMKLWTAVSLINEK